MVDGKPRPKKTIGRKIKDHQSDLATLYGLIASNEGAVSANTIGKSFGTGPPSTEKTGFLPLGGGQMNGPIGHTSEAIAISGGNLKINETAAGNPLKIQTIIFVSPESGTTDDLNTMEGRIYPGQHHILVGISGNTITIKHNQTAEEDNDERAFLCPNSTDYALEGTEAVIVFYDDTNNKWRLIGDAVVGGGGGVNFPLQYPVNDQGNQTGTVTHDLGANTGHKLQFTATGDCDITLSNIPTGNSDAIDFFIEVTQDSTGGHAITFNDSEVINPPTLTTTADTTSLLSCHADGDGNVRIITLLNASPSSGNFATKQLDNLSSPVLNTSIDFNSNAPTNFPGFTTGVGQALAVDGNGMTFDLPTGDQYLFRVNGGSLVAIAETAVALGGDITMGENFVQFDDLADASITTPGSNKRRLYFSSDSGSLVVKDSAGTVHDLEAAGSTSFDDDAFDIHDETTTTKKLIFTLDNFNAGTHSITATTTGNRTWTLPDITGELVSTQGTQTIAGTKTFSNLVTFNGNVDIGNAATDTVTITADVDSHITPANNGTQLIGSAADFWDDVFTETVSFRNGAGTETSSTKAYITSDSSTMNFHVPAGDEFLMRIGGSTMMQISEDSNNMMYLRAGAGKKLGFKTTTGNNDIGSEGTIQIPHVSGSSSTAAQADSDFGDEEGCIGIYTNTSNNTHVLVVRQDDGNWSGVTLTDNTLT